MTTGCPSSNASGPAASVSRSGFPSASCRKCAVFFECIQGIRDGRRHSYTAAKPLRDNTISVSGQFFELLLEGCEGWLAHLMSLGVRSEIGAHIQPLPRWVRRSAGSQIRPTTRGNAVSVAAALLGVSERTFYRGLAESTRPPLPTAAERGQVKAARSGIPNPVDLYRAEKAKRLA